MAHSLFALAALPLALIDLKTHRLPDYLTLPLWAVSAWAVAATAGSSDGTLAEAFASSAVVVLGLWLLAEAPGAPLGFGDVKLGGVIGLQLGVYGLEAALFALASAFIIGGIVAIWGVARSTITVTSHIAFGPHLLLGALTTLLLVG